MNDRYGTGSVSLNFYNVRAAGYLVADAPRTR